MSIDKTKLRLDIIHSFGTDFEDLLEKAQKEIAKNAGAKIALNTAKEKVMAICSVVEGDLESGALEELISGDNAGVLSLSAYVKRKIMQCAGAVENLNATVAINSKRAEGELTAYKAVFSLVQKKHEEATEKYEVQQDFLRRVASGELDEEAPNSVLDPAADIRARKEEARVAKEEAKEEVKAEEQKSDPKPEPQKKGKRKK